MIENLIMENVIIGTTVIVINLIPLITKKYNYLLLTAAISVLLMMVSIAI
ncbi:hypothetical protein J4481_01125 [Candidatus Pacearchaeota archaeon]|nr:hypothetical protein [Candidatus Pacearchaeota archaeon]